MQPRNAAAAMTTAVAVGILMNGCASLQTAASATADTILVQSAAEANRALQAQFGPSIAPYSALLLERAIELIRLYITSAVNMFA